MPDREAHAKAEMAATEIDRVGRWILVVAFLGALLAGVALQESAPLPHDPGYHPTAIEHRPVAAWIATLRDAGPRATLRELRKLQHQISAWCENDLVVVRRLRQAAQPVLLRTLHYGNGQVRSGRSGWLFYEREIDSLTGPPFLRNEGQGPQRADDPERALLAFAADLAAYGIPLAIVPVPQKSAIEARRLLGDGAPGHPVRNPSFDALAARLREAGIVLFDPGPLLFERARRGEPMFLRTDSHWRPEAVDLVAEAMAREILERGVVAEPATPRFRRTATRVVGHPDLVRLLGLPVEGEGRLYEPVTIHAVHDEQGEPFRAREAADAPILLLGDSLAGIYGWGGPSYGSAAGLPEQLAFQLQTPVGAVLEPAGGEIDSRERLARLLGEYPHFLDGKRLVILEFAERELAIGRWRPAPLPAPAGR